MKQMWMVLAAILLLVAPQEALARASRDDAAATAQRMTGGRVLSVERIRQGDREVWRVKVVTPQGEMRVIVVDVETGQSS